MGSTQVRLIVSWGDVHNKKYTDAYSRLYRLPSCRTKGSGDHSDLCEHLPGSIASRFSQPRRRHRAALMSESQSRALVGGSTATEDGTLVLAGGKRRRAPPSPVQVLSQTNDEGRGRGVNGIDVSADGTALLVSHVSGRIIVYDLARVLCGSGPASKELAVRVPPGQVTAIPSAYHALPCQHADTLTGKSPGRPQLGAYTQSAFHFDSLSGHARCTGGSRNRALFSRCGRFVLSGSGDGMAYVWELPQTPRKRFQGCISGEDVLPQLVLFGDGVENSPCEVAWGGATPGGEVSASTRIAIGANDGVVRVWRPSTSHARSTTGTVADEGGNSYRGGRDCVGLESRQPSRVDSTWGRTTDGPDRLLAIPYLAQQRRHRPQGGLLSRVNAASHLAVREAQRECGGLGSISREVEHHDIREPPTLVRRRMPDELRGGLLLVGSIEGTGIPSTESPPTAARSSQLFESVRISEPSAT